MIEAVIVGDGRRHGHWRSCCVGGYGRPGRRRRTGVDRTAVAGRRFCGPAGPVAEEPVEVLHGAEEHVGLSGYGLGQDVRRHGRGGGQPVDEVGRSAGQDATPLGRVVK